MGKLFMYEAVKLAGSMKIDADWSKPKWKNVPAVSISNHMGARPGFLPEVKSKVMYNTENLYVIFHVKDKFVRCVTKYINGPVWEDSCAEFFFAPDTGFPEKYFNLEVNCGGTPLMHYNIVPREKITELDPADIKKIEIAHTLPQVIDPEIKDDVEWSLEYRIPLSFLKKYSHVTTPEPGVIWKANFYKCAENNSNPHFLTWTVVRNPVPDFHLPKFFGQLKFI
jgi:hypothetical protein